jgi:hypothetical protein
LRELVISKNAIGNNAALNLVQEIIKNTKIENLGVSEIGVDSSFLNGIIPNFY